MKKNKDIDARLCLALALGITLFRLLLANQQMMHIYPFGAPIDDDLYFNTANSIVRGNWLGEYNYLTLSKYPMFAVYLAGVHLSGLPYLVANCLVMLATAVITVVCFAPVLKKNWQKLLVYGAFVLNPATYGAHNLRVYRDAVFPYMCILFFAGLAGWALRFKDDIKKNLPFLVIAGVGLALTYTTREDGYWVLPFGAVAMGVCIVYLVLDKKLDKKLARLVSMAVPYLMTVALVRTFCNINNKYYGVFTLSDFSGGSFAECYGNMTRLSHKNWHPLVAVPEDVRYRMYEECPTFAPFKEYLEEGSVRKSYLKSELNDFQSGSFYWALRRAAQEMGWYENAQKAQRNWAKLSAEVKRMCKKDADALGPRRSLTPPIKSYYVMPVIGEAGNSLRYVFGMKYLMAFGDALSDSYTGQIDIWQDFLHEQANYAAVENSAEPYYTPLQHLFGKVTDVITAVYKILLLPLYVVSLFLLAKSFARFEHLDFKTQILCFVILGLSLMAVFRIFIISFVEVAAFNIGTYPMYLGPAYVLFVLAAALTVALV